MPFKPLALTLLSLCDDEKKFMNPSLQEHAQCLKKNLALATPRRVLNGCLSPRLHNPAKKLETSIIKCKLSRGLSKRPRVKPSVLSPRLARVSRQLDMQRKKDNVSQGLSSRQLQPPPKMAAALENVVKTLSHKMMKDKLGNLISQRQSVSTLPSPFKPPARVRAPCLYQINQQQCTLGGGQSNKSFSFDALKLNEDAQFAPGLEGWSVAPSLQPVAVKLETKLKRKKLKNHLSKRPALQFFHARFAQQLLQDEIDWQTVPMKKKARKACAYSEPTNSKKGQSKKKGAKINKRDARKRKQPKRLTTNERNRPIEKSKNQPRQISTARAKQALSLKPYFSVLSEEDKIEHNRACAFRRILKKEAQTRKEILARMALKSSGTAN